MSSTTRQPVDEAVGDGEEARERVDPEPPLVLRAGDLLVVDEEDEGEDDPAEEVAPPL
jgi:hypothetical protein